MRPIDYALNYISLRIPREIIEIAFTTNTPMDKLTTLEDKIVSNVIQKYIRPDLNMMGGSILNLYLDRCKVEPLPDSTEFLVRVPKDLTDGLSIIRPLNISARLTNTDLHQIYNGARAKSPIAIASKMLNHVDLQPSLTSTNLELLGDNLIRCREPISVRLYKFMQVIVENKENFSNIQPQYFDKFGELCLSATKMAIYNKLVVSFDMGFIKGGHEISVIKDIVDGYSDEHENYKELLTLWKKIATLNDQHRMHKLIKINCGGCL